MCIDIPIYLIDMYYVSVGTFKIGRLTPYEALALGRWQLGTLNHNSADPCPLDKFLFQRLSLSLSVCQSLPDVFVSNRPFRGCQQVPIVWRPGPFFPPLTIFLCHRQPASVAALLAFRCLFFNACYAFSAPVGWSPCCTSSRVLPPFRPLVIACDLC